MSMRLYASITLSLGVIDTFRSTLTVFLTAD